MKTMKIMCSALLLVILVSCSSKGDSKAAADFKLKLINTIDLNKIIEEVPLWEVAEDRIFLNCPQEIVIKSIDFEGNLLNELTSVGMGPGEIKSFTYPFLDLQKKEFFYLEWAQNKFVYFDYELNYLRSEERGMSLLHYKKSYPGKVVSLNAEMGMKDKKIISHLEAAISTPDTTIIFAESEVDISNYDYATELKIASNGKIITQSFTTLGNIKFNIFDMDGMLIKEVDHINPVVPKLKEQLTQIKEVIKNGRSLKNYKNEIAITEMNIDSKDRIWVSCWNEDHSSKTLVFSRDGEIEKEYNYDSMFIRIKILDDKLFMLTSTEESNILEIYNIEG